MKQLFIEFRMINKNGAIVTKKQAVLRVRASAEISTLIVAYYKLGYRKIETNLLKKDF